MKSPQTVEKTQNSRWKDHLGIQSWDSLTQKVLFYDFKQTRNDTTMNQLIWRTQGKRTGGRQWTRLRSGKGCGKSFNFVDEVLLVSNLENPELKKICFLGFEQTILQKKRLVILYRAPKSKKQLNELLQLTPQGISWSEDLKVKGQVVLRVFNPIILGLWTNCSPEPVMFSIKDSECQL